MDIFEAIFMSVTSNSSSVQSELGNPLSQLGAYVAIGNAEIMLLLTCLLLVPQITKGKHSNVDKN